MISDQRYAYVPFYKRENGSGAAELIVIAVAVRNHPVYQTVNDALNSNATATATTAVGGLDSAYTPANTPPPTLPSPATIYPDTITLSGQTNIQEGCSVTGIPGTGTSTSSFAGRTYTCGLGTNGTFQINPGDGLALTAGLSGLWGNPYPIRDPTTSGQNFTYTSATTLQPQVAYANFQATANNPAGQIILFGSPANPSKEATPIPNAAPGAFVIVADDFPFSPLGGATTGSYQLPANQPTANPPFSVGAMNGRIFRLGSAVQGAAMLGSTFNLDPAYGMLPGGPTSPDTVPNPQIQGSGGFGSGGFGVKVYLVGVGQLNGTYSGPTQDTGVFATYFPVK
jgi:hypothetical protein